MNVADNFRRIRDSIDEEAVKAGRNPSDIELMAVTKFVDTDRIAEAVRAGAKACGENRVQEYLQKAEFFKEQGVTCDIIGRLQTNKVKYIAGQVRLIQSVDRSELAQELLKCCKKHNVKQDILIEVNIGGEEQKGGVSPEALRDLIFEISAMQAVCVKGLMCIPPAEDECAAEGYFARMRRLFEDLKSENIPNTSLQTLSMGMSGDYRAAVRQGANIVRVGTAIFGSRY